MKYIEQVNFKKDEWNRHPSKIDLQVKKGRLKGRIFTRYTQVRKRGALWRIKEGSKAAALAIGSFTLALFFSKKVRKMFKASLSGKDVRIANVLSPLIQDHGNKTNTTIQANSQTQEQKKEKVLPVPNISLTTITISDTNIGGIEENLNSRFQDQGNTINGTPETIIPSSKPIEVNVPLESEDLLTKEKLLLSLKSEEEIEEESILNIEYNLSQATLRTIECERLNTLLLTSLVALNEQEQLCKASTTAQGFLQNEINGNFKKYVHALIEFGGEAFASLSQVLGSIDKDKGVLFADGNFTIFKNYRCKNLAGSIQTLRGDIEKFKTSFHSSFEKLPKLSWALCTLQDEELYPQIVPTNTKAIDAIKQARKDSMNNPKSLDQTLPQSSDTSLQSISASTSPSTHAMDEQLEMMDLTEEELATISQVTKEATILVEKDGLDEVQKFDINALCKLALLRLLQNQSTPAMLCLKIATRENLQFVVEYVRNLDSKIKEFEVQTNAMDLAIMDPAIKSTVNIHTRLIKFKTMVLRMKGVLSTILESQQQPIPPEFKSPIFNES